MSGYCKEPGQQTLADGRAVNTRHRAHRLVCLPLCVMAGVAAVVRHRRYRQSVAIAFNNGQSD